MISLGMTEVEIDPNGYVTGTVPATPGCESKPVIGFVAHVDTSPDMKGADIRPRLIERYDGGDIPLNDSLSMRVKDFPELSFFKGHTLIVTDGTTLLGADDKAGVAEIMTAAAWLLAHPEIPHGKIRIGFTPDEEIGRGPVSPTRWTEASRASSSTRTSTRLRRGSSCKGVTFIRAMRRTR